ncbi:MAG TPA: CRISPR-associated endonuclease Cas1 [Solirubrobacterales bacterium]|nr:CRISPR-associated endonuclease Cas1 [Solirubrobacterales bacterium]
MSLVPDLLPARILNEHVYCPRLAYLEWVDRGFVDNADTVEGTLAHRRVDRERGRPPSPEELDGEGEDPPPTTSLTLSSEELGLIAKIDVVEFSKGKARPLEYKRGRPRSAAEPLWEPELVQLCAQALLLRDAGYSVDAAEVYFAGSRTRHSVPIDAALVQRTQEAARELRLAASRPEAPPPLLDSPKCPRCSLVGICLPDEVNLIRGRTESPRRLIAGDPPASPLYLTTQGARLTKRGGRAILVDEGKEAQSRRIVDISHVAVFGNATVSSALLRELFDRGVPILWFSFGGWFTGVATGMPPGNIELRQRQYRAATIGAGQLAGLFVAGKIRNARTLLRRQAKPQPKAALQQLATLARNASSERALDSLLGIEGTAARIYFQHFPGLVRRNGMGEFDFTGRNRRPPTDRINALLSFAYSMLVKDTVIACLAAGLDPFAGLYHRPRFGRPALALDLAEEFRPLIGDSTVLTAINNGEVDPEDFEERAGAVALTSAGRKKLIRTYERRMQTELKHPIFGYRASYRRSLEIQARLLAAVLSGDCPEYRPLTTR